MLPFRYALRNLGRDPARLVLTVMGSAIVVSLVMTAHALDRGMQRTMWATGRPDNVILLGAGSEESVQRSEISAAVPGIAEAAIRGIHEVAGAKAISPEIHYMAPVEFRGRRQEVYWRGVTAGALRVYPHVAVIAGRFVRPGEVMVGRRLWQRLGVKPEDLQPGAEVRLDGVTLRIAGVFAAPGTMFESEIWADLNDLRVLARRDTLSSVVIRFAPGADMGEAELFAERRLDLELVALPEPVYFAKLTRFYAPVRAMIWLAAVLMAAGAVFGGLNTLYAAFAGRVREVATLQTLGFTPMAIVISFLQESLLASWAGTMLAAMWMVLISGRWSIGVGGALFTMEADPSIIATGLWAGALVGLLGVGPPAARCLIPPLPEALRSAS